MQDRMEKKGDRMQKKGKYGAEDEFESVPLEERSESVAFGIEEKCFADISESGQSISVDNSVVKDWQTPKSSGSSSKDRVELWKLRNRAQSCGSSEIEQDEVELVTRGSEIEQDEEGY